MKNKTGDSRLLTPWLFFVLGLIGVAIVAAVVIFFSASFDIRLNEARTLSDKITNGISDNGHLKDEVLAKNYDILNNSDIGGLVFSDAGSFYLNVTILSGDMVKQSFIKGNSDFEIQCRLNNDKFAKCFEREFILLDKTNPSVFYKIKILTGSNSKGS
jgi:hypothetical protein